MLLHLGAATVLALAALGVVAGWLGAVIGIGGGVLIVPALVLAFGFPIRVAVAASLVAVVATSSAAGSAYVGEGLANMRLGMTLEIATTMGGITGGLVSAWVSPSLLATLFAGMLAVTALLMMRGRGPHAESEVEHAGEETTRGYEEPGTLGGVYHDPHLGAFVRYRPARLWPGLVVSLMAGVVSGMLGVGGGFLKVPAMTLGMRVPIKVAAATSNFMIGVTAVSSLFIYFTRGDVRPLIAAPIALGVVLGAAGGVHTSTRVSPRVLRFLLAGVLIVVSAQMALKAMGVELGR